jgi:hypothetical protein
MSEPWLQIVEAGPLEWSENKNAILLTWRLDFPEPRCLPSAEHPPPPDEHRTHTRERGNPCEIRALVLAAPTHLL